MMAAEQQTFGGFCHFYQGHDLWHKLSEAPLPKRQ